MKTNEIRIQINSERKINEITVRLSVKKIQDILWSYGTYCSLMKQNNQNCWMKYLFDTYHSFI